MKRLPLLLALLVLSIFTLSLALLPTPAASQPSEGASFEQLPPQDWGGLRGGDDLERAASKMDEAVLSQLRGAPETPLTVIVHLGGEADLSGAAQFATRAERGAYVYETLQTFAAERQASLRTALHARERSGEVERVRPFFIFNGLALTARPTTIWEVALRDDVEAVTANHEYQLWDAPTTDDRRPTDPKSKIQNPKSPEWNIAQINADDVWSQYGVLGDGVLVANLDSGVDVDHVALSEQYAGNEGGAFDHDFHWYDPINGNTVPYDDNGHGTHTMGSMVGGDGPGPFVDDIGVAPGARWIAVKAFSFAGTGESEDIHAAFEWLLAPCPAGVQPGDPSCDPSRAPAIVNNSWGSNNGARTEFLPDVQALRAAGIWPAFSAGNNGPGAGTIGSPASFAEAFATGATDSSDVIAGFSSRGPSPLTEEIKPDVVAPGVDVRSAVPGGGYASYNGTSMASPHSSGLGALMLSAAPGLTLDEMETIIKATTVDLGPPGPEMDYGYGRIDAFVVMQRLLSSGDLAGTVSDMDTGQPIGGAQVAVTGQGIVEETTADGAGEYRVNYLVQGEYTATANYYGYEPLTITNVTIVTDQVTTLDLELDALPRYTLSGHIYDAETSQPITDAMISVLDTPLPTVQTDASGFYSLTVAAGPAVVEAAAFSYATAVTQTTVTTDTTMDFSLQPLPPILLVDDDEGGQRSYSPHVEEHYFAALDANGYNYSYWDIEAEDGAPDFDTIRQYAALVWFGGEFGRIKDISDAGQAQAVMEYLDLGGRLLYVSQEHTFYYGDDAACDTPRWGGTGPCPFTEHYLGVADWVEDQKAEVAYGVAGNPVGDGLGPITLDYPPFLTDFSDQITGTVHASLAFSATDDAPPGDVNDIAYTVISPTHSFKTAFFASPLEAMPPADMADAMFQVMEWFGVQGLTEGVTLAPGQQAATAPAGETIEFTLRARNLSSFADTFTLSVEQAPWPTTIWDASFSTQISEIGPLAPQETADVGVRIEVPPGTPPGAEATSLVRALSQSGTPHSDMAALTAKAKMVYRWRDSDACSSGVHYEWVDATGGDHYDLDDDGSAPEFISVTLPAPFVFYNESYDHLWINDHATILFGDDNIYDDQFPSGEPPIPNPTLLDPNGALYLAWGTSFWHPSDEPAEAGVYTYHDTSNGRNWFVIEYHLYPNLLGEVDTMEVILDLDSYEITYQYQTVSYHRFAVVGIENQIGTEGILYVNDQEPPARTLHDGLALRFFPDEPPGVLEVSLLPDEMAASGDPNEIVEYTFTVSSTSSLTDVYALEVNGNAFPTSFWDPSFSVPVDEVGPLPPCSEASVGVRVALPNTSSYVRDEATVRARSQSDTLVVGSARLTTDNAAPDVLLGPDQDEGAPSGGTVTYTLALQNTGNITDRYELDISGAAWPTAFAPPATQTGELAPGATELLTVTVEIPADTPSGELDQATVTATSQSYPGTSDSALLTTEAVANIAVDLEPRYQTQFGPGDWTVSYFVTIRNAGNLDDAFTLATFAEEWETSLWNDSFTEPLTRTTMLGPDETQRIGVRVRTAPGIAPPEQDAALIMANSTLDEGTRDYAMLVTQAEAVPRASGGAGVVVDPAGDFVVTTELSATYSLRITNTGTAPDSFTLSAIEGQLEHPATTGTLQPGEGTTVAITHHIEVPTGRAPEDLPSQAALLVTSDSDSSASDRVDFITIYIADAFPIQTLDATNDSPTELGQPTTLWACAYDGSNPDCEGITYEWEFGDGTTGSGEQVQHTYPAIGSYTAIVTATNAVSAMSTTTEVTIVGPETPTPTATATIASSTPTATPTTPAATPSATTPAATPTATAPGATPTATVTAPAATPTATVPGATPTATLTAPAATPTVSTTPGPAGRTMYLPVVVR